MCRLGGHAFIFPCSTLAFSNEKKKNNAKASERENAKIFKNKCFFFLQRVSSVESEFLASQSEHSDTSLKKRIFSDFFNFILFTLSFFPFFGEAVLQFENFSTLLALEIYRSSHLNSLSLFSVCVCANVLKIFSSLYLFSLLWCAMSPR